MRSSVVTGNSYLRVSDLCTYSVGKTIGSLVVGRVMKVSVVPPLGSQDSIQTQDQ